MDLFRRRLRPSGDRDYARRLAALEDYVEYLRQQGEYAFSQAGKDRAALADRGDAL